MRNINHFRITGIRWIMTVFNNVNFNILCINRNAVQLVMSLRIGSRFQIQMMSTGVLQFCKYFCSFNRLVGLAIRNSSLNVLTCF